jgi:phosphatidylserine decarboxylase
MEYIRYLPKNHVSRWIGKIVHQREPKWLVEKARAWFIERYKINMAEAEFSVDQYPSIGDLFIRKLKPGARPIQGAVVHPCDAQLTVTGEVRGDRLIQSKGIDYSLNEFLFDSSAADTFQGGQFFTYYLCPTDYHRVHTPIAGEVTKTIHVPGRLWPVNPWSVENISQLFAVNERLVFRLQTAQGPVAVVMIGATNVGQISVSFDPKIRTNVAGITTPVTKNYSPAVKVAAGDELGIFHMGSSVVVVYPPGVVNKAPLAGPVKLGEALG